MKFKKSFNILFFTSEVIFSSVFLFQMRKQLKLRRAPITIRQILTTCTCRKPTRMRHRHRMMMKRRNSELFNIWCKPVCDLYKEFVIRGYYVLKTRYPQCHYNENKESIVIRRSKIIFKVVEIVMVCHDVTLKPILFETEIKKCFILALQIHNI